MKKTITSFMLLISLIVCIFQPAAASSKSLSELEKENKNINSEIKNTQNQLNSTQTEMAKVDAEIRELDDKLTTTVDELETIDQSLSETAELLAKTEEELEQAQRDRDSQFETFQSRLRVMHEYGTASFLEVLFQASSIRDFLTRFEYINDVAKYDEQMVDLMQAAEDRVAVKVEDMARQKNTIEALQYAQTVKYQSLQDTLAERQAYFEQLDADEQRYQALLNQQKEDEKVIQAAYKKAKEEEDARQRALQAQRQAAATAVTYNGVMLWPAPNYKRISDTYRQRTNPVNKKTEFHSGVDIASAMGNNIVAADSGVVVLASYNGGYGNCVIINHGGGISTLYGHSSKLLVTVGQSVKKGEVIAKIGSTGISSGPHLHFEVRINGNHTNPKPYLGY